MVLQPAAGLVRFEAADNEVEAWASVGIVASIGPSSSACPLPAGSSDCLSRFAIICCTWVLHWNVWIGEWGVQSWGYRGAGVAVVRGALEHGVSCRPESDHAFKLCGCPVRSPAALGTGRPETCTLEPLQEALQGPSMRQQQSHAHWQSAQSW